MPFRWSWGPMCTVSYKGADRRVVLVARQRVARLPEARLGEYACGCVVWRRPECATEGRRIHWATSARRGARLGRRCGIEEAVA
jgi:hypothetical protein